MADFMSLVKWYYEKNLRSKTVFDCLKMGSRKKSEALEGKQLFTRLPVYKNGKIYYIDLVMKYYSIDEIEKVILEYPGFRRNGAFIDYEDKGAGICGHFSWITRGIEAYNISIKPTPAFLNEEKLYILDYTTTLPIQGNSVFTDIKIIRMYCEFILEEARNLKIAMKRMSLETDFDSK